jgi:signal transduction histidine kinase
VEQLLERDPVAARRLVVDARETSAKALGELRDLVRGIHPPVLADRGLADAVRALALDSPLDISVDADLGDRLPAPVESAAYFAFSELLANIAKHADAQQIRVDLRRRAGLVRMTVTDDGTGGADLANGTGLRGIQRRVSAFDGTLAVVSPVGGPTVVTVEIPCGS